MRRLVTIGVVAAIAAAAFALEGPSAQSQNGASPGHNFTVRKVVNGVSASGFVVQVVCEVFDDGGPGTFDLPFLASGAPDPNAPPAVTNQWEIVDGAWLRHGGGFGDERCTVNETQNGGAASTSYACQYEAAAPPLIGSVESENAAAFDVPTGAALPGCSEAQGTTGPTVVFGRLPLGCFPEGQQEPLICRDQAFVTVTNTFPVVVDPVAVAFTG